MGIFNTTHNHNHRTEYVPYVKEVNVNENRAATDESIRLLNEMQDKAQMNIIATILIDLNHIKAIAIYFQDDVVQRRINYCLKFEINGQTHLVDGHIDGFEWDKTKQDAYLGLGIKEVYEALHRRFADAVTAELMSLSSDFLNNNTK